MAGCWSVLAFMFGVTGLLVYQLGGPEMAQFLFTALCFAGLLNVIRHLVEINKTLTKYGRRLDEGVKDLLGDDDTDEVDDEEEIEEEE